MSNFPTTAAVFSRAVVQSSRVKIPLCDSAKVDKTDCPRILGNVKHAWLQGSHTLSMLPPVAATRSALPHKVYTRSCPHVLVYTVVPILRSQSSGEGWHFFTSYRQDGDLHSISSMEKYMINKENCRPRFLHTFVVKSFWEARRDGGSYCWNVSGR